MLALIRRPQLVGIAVRLGPSLSLEDPGLGLEDPLLLEGRVLGPGGLHHQEPGQINVLWITVVIGLALGALDHHLGGADLLLGQGHTPPDKGGQIPEGEGPVHTVGGRLLIVGDLGQGDLVPTGDLGLHTGLQGGALGHIEGALEIVVPGEIRDKGDTTVISLTTRRIPPVTTTIWPTK